MDTTVPHLYKTKPTFQNVNALCKRRGMLYARFTKVSLNLTRKKVTASSHQGKGKHLVDQTISPKPKI